MFCARLLWPWLGTPLVALWYGKLCASSCMDDATFLHNGVKWTLWHIICIPKWREDTVTTEKALIPAIFCSMIKTKYSSLVMHLGRSLLSTTILSEQRSRYLPATASGLHRLIGNYSCIFYGSINQSNAAII